MVKAWVLDGSRHLYICRQCPRSVTSCLSWSLWFIWAFHLLWFRARRWSWLFCPHVCISRYWCLTQTPFEGRSFFTVGDTHWEVRSSRRFWRVCYLRTASGRGPVVVGVYDSLPIKGGIFSNGKLYYGDSTAVLFCSLPFPSCLWPYCRCCEK